MRLVASGFFDAFGADLQYEIGGTDIGTDDSSYRIGANALFRDDLEVDRLLGMIDTEGMLIASFAHRRRIPRRRLLELTVQRLGGNLGGLYLKLFGLFLSQFHFQL